MSRPQARHNKVDQKKVREDLNPLIRYLVYERIIQGVPQLQQSVKVGVSLAAFRRWEDGTHEPKVTNLQKWAESLGLRIEFLPEAEYISR